MVCIEEPGLSIALGSAWDKYSFLCKAELQTLILSEVGLIVVRPVLSYLSCPTLLGYECIKNPATRRLQPSLHMQPFYLTKHHCISRYCKLNITQKERNKLKILFLLSRTTVKKSNIVANEYKFHSNITSWKPLQREDTQGYVFDDNGCSFPFLFFI